MPRNTEPCQPQVTCRIPLLLSNMVCGILCSSCVETSQTHNYYALPPRSIQVGWLGCNLLSLPSRGKHHKWVILRALTLPSRGKHHKWVILRALTHRLAAVIPQVPLPLMPNPLVVRPLVPLLVINFARNVTHGMPIQAVAGASNVISSHSHHERDSVLRASQSFFSSRHKDAIVQLKLFCVAIYCRVCDCSHSHHISLFSFVLVTIELL